MTLLGELEDADVCRVQQALDSLSPIEREVLRDVIDGSTAEVSAQTLALNRRTVEHHRARILRKLGAPNFVAAIRAIALSSSGYLVALG